MFPLGQCHRVGPETWVLVLSSSVRACSALLGCSVVSLFFSLPPQPALFLLAIGFTDRKSTRLNSSHLVISYAVFCLKKKKHHQYYSIVLDIAHHLPNTHYISS